MRRIERILHMVRVVAAPLATFAFASLALELLAPGIVAQWVSLPIFFFGLLLLSMFALHYGAPSPQSSPARGEEEVSPSLDGRGKGRVSRTGSFFLLTSIGVFSTIVVRSLVGNDWRFLLFTFLATVVVALKIVRS